MALTWCECQGSLTVFEKLCKRDAATVLQSRSEAGVLGEETGLRAAPVAKLADTRYVYTWRGERVFKVVSFFLLRYRSGRIGEISEAMRIEVAEARWLPLEDAPRLLAYRGEREVAAQAVSACVDHGL